MYVYGDFCSGEIFTCTGTTQSVLLDTDMYISSFLGQDQLGELYVVGYFDGSVSRIVSTHPPPCTYEITPWSQDFTAAGGTGTVSVTPTPTDCTWTAASSYPAWLHVTSGSSSGSGIGTVGFSVDANTTLAARIGTLTIAGLTFTVNQAAMACTYSISPTSQNITAAGGTETVSVAITSDRVRVDRYLEQSLLAPGDVRIVWQRNWHGRLLGGREHRVDRTARHPDHRRDDVHSESGRRGLRVLD